jgi:hypothetical protein
LVLDAEGLCRLFEGRNQGFANDKWDVTFDGKLKLNGLENLIIQGLCVFSFVERTMSEDRGSLKWLMISITLMIGAE